MHRCQICGRDDFKTVQGLLGHQRMKHPGRFAKDGTLLQPNSPQGSGPVQASGPQSSGPVQRSDAQGSGQVQTNGPEDSGPVQSSGAEGSQLNQGVVTRDECLTLIDSSVKRQLAGMEPPAHVHDPATCQGCRSLVDEILGENPDDGDHHHHVHGDGCPECLVEQEKGGRRSMQRTAIFYEALPGVTEIREHQLIEQQAVSIIDDRPTVRTEDLDHATFKLVLNGMIADVKENGDRSSSKADLPRMLQEAVGRGIR